MNVSKSNSESVLVVDDVPLNLEVIVDYLLEAGYETYVATSGEETLEQLELIKPDLILLDVMLPGINGFETCRQIKKNQETKDIPIIFMTALAEVSDKVIGFQAGGVDYITKPIQREEIMARVNTHLSMRNIQKQLHDANENLENKVAERTAQLNSALEKVEQLKTKLQAENAYLQEEIKAELNFNEIIGQSESIKNVMKDIQEVAQTDTTVLILGETGTGKEVIARALHTASNRSTKSLIKVNCAAIPDNLVESEFFGHEKGAFTGASAKRDGRFTLADNGTIFLDEIGELPLDLQSKLLRVLQEGEFDPVGSSKTKKVDVRVIAATNRNLKEIVQAGEFREDLYYRLSVFPIEIPPLRDRGEDVILLASYFAQKCAQKMRKEIAPISKNFARRLFEYNWPGNIRELQNVIERAAITANEGHLNLDRALPETVNEELKNKLNKKEKELSKVLTIQELHEIERDNIVNALNYTDWKVAGDTGAAALLQMKPTTLNSRIKALGIKRF